MATTAGLSELPRSRPDQTLVTAQLGRRRLFLQEYAGISEPLRTGFDAAFLNVPTRRKNQRHPTEAATGCREHRGPSVEGQVPDRFFEIAFESRPWTPTIGAEFLAHFSLLPDKRLIYARPVCSVSCSTCEKRNAKRFSSNSQVRC